MLTPAAIAAPSYYKIGDKVTFGWNYTSLLVTPSAVDILVSCSANSALYTLLANASVGSTGSVTWDTSAQETGQNPLLTETYTLVIHDSQAAITAQPQAGYLATYNQFTFGMYLRQAYQPLPGMVVYNHYFGITINQITDFVCATCSGATNLEQQTLKFMFGMCMVTVFSFTWFAGSFGLF